MEDEGTIKKSTIFLIVFLILTGIVIIFYFLFREDGILNQTITNPAEELPTESEVTINETGIYGRFLNKDDSNSYLEIKEDDSFVFVLNVCEGYVTYNNENSVLSKNISFEDGTYHISLNIRPDSSYDSGNFNFTGKTVSDDGIVDEYSGPTSCYPSGEYKRS